MKRALTILLCALLALSCAAALAEAAKEPAAAALEDGVYTATFSRAA